MACALMLAQSRRGLCLVDPQVARSRGAASNSQGKARGSDDGAPEKAGTLELVLWSPGALGVEVIRASPRSRVL